MSHELGQTMLVWHDVLASLRRKPVSWQGNPLSEKDLHTFTEALVMCALHLTDISSRFEGIGTRREFVAWTHFVCTLDVHELGSFLSDAITELRHVSAPMAYGGFKRRLSEKYPFTGAFLNPIRDALGLFLQDPSPRRFSPCYQFLCFLTHLSLADLAIDLEDEYIETEAYLRTLSYPPIYLGEMNQIMREWMKGFSISEDNFFPQHGPGGTAETARSAFNLEKYLYLGTDPMIDYVFSKFAGFNVESYYPLEKLYVFSRVSQLVFVPKSMKTRRAISKEPATLQFLQQGVFRALDRFIADHEVLSKHISLHNQERNARLAVDSSGTQKFATIDLSSASDTVTTELVKAVFRGTSVYPYLVALRSHTVLLPSGKELRVAKYAPMGSALCFPVETLIFACAVELAVRRAHREGVGNKDRPYRVYGDDIIVPAGLFEDTLRILDSLGFIANQSKSFGPGSRFRESCGAEGYDGVDVTPLRISRNFYSPPDRWASSHAALYTGLIDFANQCEVYQFHFLRAWVIQRLLNGSATPPLFAESGDGALYSPNPDNFRARWRLSPSQGKNWFQREEIRVRVVKSRPRKGRKTLVDDRILYWESLRLTQQRDRDVFFPEDAIHTQSGPCVNLLLTGWVNNPSSRLTLAELKSQLSDNAGGEG